MPQDDTMYEDSKAAEVSEHAKDVELCVDTDAAHGWYTARRKLLAEGTMIVAWLISGLDFLAPVLWLGFPGSATSAWLLATAALWLCGSFLMILGLLQPACFKPSDRAAALLWTIAAFSGIASLDLASLDSWTAAAWCGLVGYIAWLLAAVLWSLVSWACIRPTLILEQLTTGLWLLCGVAFLFGTIADDSLSGTSRWAYLSSSIWWCIGVLAWMSFLSMGGSFWV
eukprot:TRINITY_DN114675_c0_g1_i1.p1 TRINITY_DN114675_c0_g1~~TRINITY_DN114675_c0_g1_i1.p1  ORF type:complete len:226 (+),score=37.83 TRINITY_DN114675_c0_g1_i1:95-772(+)